MPTQKVESSCTSYARKISYSSLCKKCSNIMQIFYPLFLIIRGYWSKCIKITQFNLISLVVNNFNIQPEFHGIMVLLNMLHTATLIAILYLSLSFSFASNIKAEFSLNLSLNLLCKKYIYQK